MARKMNPNSLKNLEKGRFKKGVVTNPRGRQKLSIGTVVEELKSQGYTVPTASEIATMYKVILALDEGELKARIGDTSQPMLVRIVARNILGGKGFDIIERMLDRSIGRATVQIEHSGEIKGNEPLTVEIIDRREQVEQSSEE